MKVTAPELIPHDLILGPYNRGREFTGFTGTYEYESPRGERVVKYGAMFREPTTGFGSIDGLWEDEEFEIERRGLCGDCNACDLWETWEGAIG